MRHLLDSSGLYPLLNWGYVFWGGRLKRKSAIFITYQRYVLSTSFIIVDFNIDHLVEIVLGFLTVK